MMCDCTLELVYVGVFVTGSFWMARERWSGGNANDLVQPVRWLGMLHVYWR